MTLNFVQENFIGQKSPNIKPTLTFFRKGFRIGGSSSIDYRDVILSGIGALTLVNAKANGLNYVKLFGDCIQEEKLGSVTLSGACELRELPSEYTQLEYIRATGTQYINTGYAPVIGDEIYIKYRFTTVGSDNVTFYCLLSAGASSNVNAYQLIMIEGKSPSIPAGGFFYKYFANGSATTVSFSPVVDTWYTANITSTGTLTTGGVSETSTPAGEISGDDKDLYLFIRANMASPFLGDIAELTITNNGTTKLNLVPVKRNSDNAIGMYDIVTQKFLPNAGTGVFVAGTTIHNVPSEYTQLNYLRSNGGYINTGYIPTVNTSIEYNVAFASVTANNCLFGTRTSGSYSSSTNQFYGGVYVANSNKIYWYSGTTRTNTSIVPENGVYYNITCTNEHMKGTPEYPIALFTLNNAGTLASSTVMDLAYFKIYESNVLVRNLLPVKRNSDNALGLYDTVTNTFFAGTGDFIAGTEKSPTPAKPMNIISNNGTLKFRNKNGLPDTYIQLEYIQSDGACYIDLLRVPNNDDIIEQKFQRIVTVTGTYSWYGSMPSSSQTTPRIGIGAYTSGNRTIFIGVNSTVNITREDSDVNTIRFQVTGNDKITCTYNGETTIYTATANTYEPVITLTSYLFARHGEDGVQAYDGNGTKIFYHKEYLADGTLALNVVPCRRKSDNALGMYDTVTGNFLTNAGTGSLTAGDIDYSAYEIYVDGEVETVEDSLDNTATAEMLLGVGTYADSQEVLSGAITRKCGIIILNGSENWYLNSGTGYRQFHITTTQGVITNNVSLISNITPYGCTTTNRDTYGFGCYSGNSGNLCFQMIDSPTLKNLYNWQSFLTTRYNEGRPVIVVYPLATATTESVESQVLEELPIIQTAGSIDNLPINAVMQETPTPDKPLNIICNNGTFKVRNKNGLPSDYIQVEYLQSSGTQYIDTGVRLDYAKDFRIRGVVINPQTNKRKVVIGNYTTNNNASFSIEFATSTQVGLTTDGIRVFFGSKNTSYYSESTGALPINTKIDIDFAYTASTKSFALNCVAGGQTYTLNGIVTNIGNVIADEPLCIFLDKRSSGVSSIANGLIIESLSFEQDTISKNYVSSKNSLNELGMYDTVSDTFYTNDGTGSFTSGDIDYSAYEIYTDGTTETVKDSLDNTATAEMLLKVGTYQDEQSVIDGSVIRNVGVKVLDGTENWEFRNQSLSLFYATIASTYFNDNQTNHLALSTNFLGVEVNNPDMPNNSCKCASLVDTNSLQLFIKSTDFESAENLKAWLASQYSLGTPVIVVYPLATPTTETVTGQTLTTQRGTNVIEITQASIDGLPLEVSYKAGVTVTVEEVENANLDNSVTVTIGE